MTKQQISDDGIFWLIIISGIFIIATVLGMIIAAHLPKENCWDNYTTEQQSIQNCEIRNE